VFRRQAIEFLLDVPFLLGFFQGVFRPAQLGSVDRLAARLPCPTGSQRIDGPLLPLQTDGRIESDPVQPGEKLGVALEAAQRLVRVKESVLHHVLGVFRVINQPVDGIKETVLIATNQFTEGCRSPLQTLSDKPMIVRVHGFLFWLDALSSSMVPKGQARMPTEVTGDVLFMMPNLAWDVKNKAASVAQPHIYWFSNWVDEQ